MRVHIVLIAASASAMQHAARPVAQGVDAVLAQAYLSPIADKIDRDAGDLLFGNVQKRFADPEQVTKLHRSLRMLAYMLRGFLSNPAHLQEASSEETEKPTSIGSEGLPSLRGSRAIGSRIPPGSFEESYSSASVSMPEAPIEDTLETLLRQRKEDGNERHVRFLDSMPDLEVSHASSAGEEQAETRPSVPHSETIESREGLLELIRFKEQATTRNVTKNADSDDA